MLVVKVLVVQIQPDTILSYSEQVLHKRISGTHINFGLQTVVYQIILSESSVKKIEFDVLP